MLTVPHVRKHSVHGKVKGTRKAWHDYKCGAMATRVEALRTSLMLIYYRQQHNAYIDLATNLYTYKI
jgi:hypothetical protein